MINFQLFESGYCQHCQRITIQSGRFKIERYPALCSLLQHPTHGNILFDTGYSGHFDKASQRFPERLYQWITPVHQTQSLKTQLRSQNIRAENINYIIISHFHSDHISALKDFPNAKFICHPNAWQSIKSVGRFKGLLKAFMPSLLPNDFEKRLHLLKPTNQSTLPKALKPFSLGMDIFSDKTLYAIDLPGHAEGHIGLYFKSAEDKKIFLIADGCWHQSSYQKKSYPSRLTHLIHHNSVQYKQTINKLHELYQKNKSIEIIPSHCSDKAKQIWSKKTC